MLGALCPFLHTGFQVKFPYDVERKVVPLNVRLLEKLLAYYGATRQTVSELGQPQLIAPEG
jgi:hypothetical protein